jgi:predicted transcriptional regulator
MLRVKGFGDLEAEIMDRLWIRGAPATVREVLEILRQEREIAYTTVMTVMDNLHRKGSLERTMEHRAWLYRPAFTREMYSASLMEQALAHSKDQLATLVHFVETMSENEEDILRLALRKAKTRAAKSAAASRSGPT